MPGRFIDRLTRDLVARLIDRQKVSQESVNYRPAEGPHHCGNCDMFKLNPPDFESGSCDLVQGLIDPHHVCDRWEARS